MDLRRGTCHSCYLRDGAARTPFLMSADNDMDPGDLPACLPGLTQVEEMVIARSHVQMMVCRYRGHQYRYCGHCVSFMQNTVKTVYTLPNLPSELDIVVLRCSNRASRDDPRYQRQFRPDFRIRRRRIVTWLRFLKEHHPDYRYVTISPDRIASLALDADVSSSFPAVDDDAGAEDPLAPANHAHEDSVGRRTATSYLSLNDSEPRRHHH